MTTKPIYCSKCHQPVTPIRNIVNYCCPKCGATFMASQVEQPLAREGEGKASTESHVAI